MKLVFNHEEGRFTNRLFFQRGAKLGPGIADTFNSATEEAFERRLEVSNSQNVSDSQKTSRETDHPEHNIVVVGPMTLAASDEDVVAEIIVTTQKRATALMVR